MIAVSIWATAVPVALSSSHIAYGSMRMEPVFMVLGESAAAAGSVVDQYVAVQDVPYDWLRKQLVGDRQVLGLPATSEPESAQAAHSDDSSAEIGRLGFGEWFSPSTM